MFSKSWRDTSKKPKKARELKKNSFSTNSSFDRGEINSDEKNERKENLFGGNK